MPTDRLAGQDGSARPRVIVSVTATADGRVTLSRAERLLDDGPNVRWKAMWPPGEHRLDPAGVRTHQHVAVQEIAVDQVAALRAGLLEADGI